MIKPPKKPRSIGLLNEEELPLRSQRRRPRDPAQPQLPFDPMPARIEPCLAVLANKPPIGPDWAFEVKWDGYRVAVHIEPNRVRILTRADELYGEPALPHFRLPLAALFEDSTAAEPPAQTVS